MTEETKKLQLTMKPQAFKQALEFVAVAISREETRYYLRGVCFSKKIDEPLFMVATDGHRLHKIEVDFASDITPEMEFNFIMPAIMVKQIIRMIGKTLKYSTLDIGKELVFNNFEAHYGTKPIDAKYPDFDRVIPKDKTPKLFESYNSKYLHDSFKAFGKLGRLAAISAFGSPEESAPLLLECERLKAIAVLMPVRT